MALTAGNALGMNWQLTIPTNRTNKMETEKTQREIAEGLPDGELAREATAMGALIMDEYQWIGCLLIELGLRLAEKRNSGLAQRRLTPRNSVTP
jgi:hypothetical protein